MAGKKAKSLEVVHPDCAGIDVGKGRHYVAVDPLRFEEPVCSFGSFTDDLEALAAWLSARGVREVAMESTGVCWIPVFEVLDRAGLEVHLVNPRATKQVSGQKSDVWTASSAADELRAAARGVPGARSDSGTRCSRLAFMRSRERSKWRGGESISCQRVPRTSPEREALSIGRSRASMGRGRCPSGGSCRARRPHGRAAAPGGTGAARRRRLRRRTARSAGWASGRVGK